MKKNTIEKDKLLKMFVEFDTFLSTPQEICIIGSSILIYLDMPLRATMDMDIWQRMNKEDLGEIQKSIIKSGYLFDPDNYNDLDEPYVQVVKRNFVHMPINNDWEENCQTLWQGSKLKVVHPPFEIIAASKLAAGRERDFDDVKFLFQLEPDLANKIEQAKLLFNEDDQQEISDNLTIIELMLNKPPKTYKIK